VPGTLVVFHAHPDDESILTAGTMARAAAEGHRVVLVVATRGDHGEVAEGVLGPGESLAERRVEETRAAADALGVARVEFLGYVDSGMMGEPENDAPGSFWSADVEEAARHLAAILEDEGAEVLTTYDERGGYDHPDHVQVHRVGVRAAALAGTPRVYEATIDREHVREMIRETRAELDPATEVEEMPDPDTFDVGVDSEHITTTVDVRAFADAKRAAMAAHASQIPPDSFFLSVPPELFAESFGTEWFILRGAPPRLRETWLFGSGGAGDAGPAATGPTPTARRAPS
jgi:LmbE family N-acetylglucosaminyl deacetylase